MESRTIRKARGAFFTPPEIAHALAAWAVRSADDTVLEPSCGEASILLAAADRLKRIGARPSRWRERLHGVEIFAASARTAEARLREAGFDAAVAVGDFFEYDAPAAFDAVVGNPPFVRYQNFSGAARARALEAALAQGVRLSGLAGSWAAFAVAAARHVSPDGRLALVLPAELLSVDYAREVRRFLLRRFRRVRIVAFDERVFPGVLEEVVLLLAEGSGGATRLEVCRARDAGSLGALEAAAWTTHAPVDGEKWTPALVAKEALAIYRALAGDRFEPLGAWGGAYLGAVTGSNRFFALTMTEARARGLADNDTVRISPPGARHLREPRFTDAMWRRLAADGARCLLLAPRGEPSDAARRYVAEGERAGVAKAYKCRVRKPWWRVPRVDAPDLIVTYMNNDRPRLVDNAARAEILNSVYGVRLAPERRPVGRGILPIACLNSVTLLGAELVGRAYGGGLLKMEPREADNLPVPTPGCLERTAKALRSLGPKVALSPRADGLRDVVEAVDAIVLADVPGGELRKIRAARETLFRRRRARGREWRRSTSGAGNSRCGRGTSAPMLQRLR